MKGESNSTSEIFLLRMYVAFDRIHFFFEVQLIFGIMVWKLFHFLIANCWSEQISLHHVKVFSSKKLSGFDPRPHTCEYCSQNGKIAICQFNVIEFLSQSCKLLSNAIFRERRDRGGRRHKRSLSLPYFISSKLSRFWK